VVEAADRVADASDQTIVAMTRMGEGDGWSEQQGHGAQNAFKCHG
jgi:hypothetical protein